MNLFTSGQFTSHSGLSLSFKIDCDALTDSDFDCLARQYAATIGGNDVFGEIVGVPRGGIRFAEALGRYVPTGGPIAWRTNIIVDDVLTTGRSMEEFWHQRYPNRFSGIRGLVIFARGPCPNWVRPIFTLNPEMGP